MTTWMDLEGIMLSEINQTEKTNTIQSLSYVEYKKKQAIPPQKNLNIPNKNKHVDTENRVVVTRGGGKEDDMGKESTI